MITQPGLPQTMPLLVQRIEHIALDICQIEFANANGDALPAFTAGSHVFVYTPGGMLRQYSLCNSPSETWRYVIAVKRDRSGRGGSIDLVDNIKVGDVLQVSLPRNEFEFAEGAPRYLFIAGGIGITPIRAMIARLQATSDAPFKLYYCTRNAESTAFLEELGAPEFNGKVVIHHDNGDPAHALDFWDVLEEQDHAHLYCCGPRPLMEAVRATSGHWPSASVHFEDFGGAVREKSSDDKTFTVRLMRSDRVVEVPPGITILEALRTDGINVLSSCESGTCGSCKTSLLGGDADHRDFVLAEDEKQDNIMVCVSRAKSSELLLDL
jgi:phthalate 4,5-dioxygenase reductase subunit